MRDRRKKDFIYEELLNRLMSAQYRFGERIWVKELTEELAVSRQPVMAALNALSAEGFVEIQAQVGCEVISPAPEEVADFYAVLAKTEGVVTQLAARRRTQHQSQVLEEINARIHAIDPGAADAGEQFRVLNRRFHSHIRETANSGLVHDIQARMFSMSDFFIAQSVAFVSHWRVVADEHDAVVHAISDRDEIDAYRAAEKHITSSGAQVVRGLELARALLGAIPRAPRGAISSHSYYLSKIAIRLANWIARAAARIPVTA